VKNWNLLLFLSRFGVIQATSFDIYDLHTVIYASFSFFQLLSWIEQASS